MTSAGAKLPTEVVDETPVKFCTADPNPINEPKVNSACIPDNKAASFGTTTEPVPNIVPKLNSDCKPVKVTSSFGTTTDPCEVVNQKPEGKTAVPTKAIGVPNVEVIDCPVRVTSSFGATADP